MPIRQGRPADAQQRILDGIDQDIRLGKLPPGSALPAVRALASQFGCDPVTAQSACRELERRGTFTRVGNGTRSKLIATGRRIATMAGALVIVSSNPPGERPHEPGWSAQELHGAMGTAQAVGATVVVIPPEDFTAARMVSWRQEGLLGIIAIGARIDSAREQLDLCCSDGIPVVATDYILPGLRCDRVGSDHQAGGRLLAEHLIAEGRRRLVTLWAWGAGHPDDHPWAIARQAGIAAACAAAGLPAPLRRIWTTSEDPAEATGLALEQVRELLASNQPPDALLAHTDGVVAPVIQAVQRCGKRVHQDLAVAGYDNYIQATSVLRPCVTIDKCNASIGAELVRVLLERQADKPTAKRIHRLIPPLLIR